MAEEEQEEVISEGAEYSPKSEFSKPRVVEKAVIICLEARGKEMKSGYNNTKIDKNGDPQTVYIPDTRKIFIGTVEALRGLLAPEIKEHSNVKKEINELLEYVEKAFEKYCYTKMANVKNGEGRLTWEKTKSKVMPEIDAEVIIPNPQFPNRAMIVKKGWNLKINAYWDEVADIYHEIFSELNCLAHALNYFKTGISF
jgi:hypothetical protein